MMLRKLAIHILKNDFRHVFTPYPIINSVWVKVLNLIGENIKLKETNIRTKLHDLGFDHGFLDMSLEEQEQIFFHQNLKMKQNPPTNICASKDTIKKVKGQSGQWKKITSFQLLSRVRLCVSPWTAARPASLSITNSVVYSNSESVMPSKHLILSRPLLLSPSVFPSIRVFSSESALPIKWPKYWSFSFNISPSNEHPGLISFRMDFKGL